MGRACPSLKSLAPISGGFLSAPICVHLWLKFLFSLQAVLDKRFVAQLPQPLLVAFIGLA